MVAPIELGTNNLAETQSHIDKSSQWPHPVSGSSESNLVPAIVVAAVRAPSLVAGPGSQTSFLAALALVTHPPLTGVGDGVSATTQDTLPHRAQSLPAPIPSPLWFGFKCPLAPYRKCAPQGWRPVR